MWAEDERHQRTLGSKGTALRLQPRCATCPHLLLQLPVPLLQAPHGGLLVPQVAGLRLELIQLGRHLEVSRGEGGETISSFLEEREWERGYASEEY